MDGVLPLLTIQPLLENAVEHGIAPAGGGTITIRCALNDACMRIEIINTGRGAEKEDPSEAGRLSEIRYKIKK